MGLFEHFPYTNLHTLNLDWILRKMKAFEASLKDLSDKVDNIEDVSEEVDDLKTSDETQNEALEDLDGRLETAEGAIGDLQTSVSGIHGIPSGGSPGQVLAKASADDYAVEWVNQEGGGGSGGSSRYFSYELPNITYGGTATLTGFTDKLMNHYDSAYGILEIVLQLHDLFSPTDGIEGLPITRYVAFGATSEDCVFFGITTGSHELKYLGTLSFGMRDARLTLAPDIHIGTNLYGATIYARLTKQSWYSN